MRFGPPLLFSWIGLALAAGAAESPISGGSMRGLEISVPGEDGQIEATLSADGVQWMDGGKIEMVSGTARLLAEEEGEGVVLKFEEAVYDSGADRIDGEGVVEISSIDGSAQAVGFAAYLDERRLKLHEAVTAETPEYTLSGDSGEIWYASGEGQSDPVITRIDVCGNVVVELQEPRSSDEFDFVRVTSEEVQADRISRVLRILTPATGWTADGKPIAFKLREDQPYLNYTFPAE